MLEKLKLLFKRFFAQRPVLEISYSKISAFHFCPWKYKLIYEDGYKVPPNANISLGLTVHRALEEFHKKETNGLDELIEFYDRFWVNEGFQSPQQTVLYYEKGRKMLAKYFEFHMNRKSEVIAIEKEFRFSLGRRMLRGIIDRIDRLPDGTYEVIDYKTHAEMWDQPRIDSDLQLTLYSLGTKRALHLEPLTLSYFFLAHDKTVSTIRTEKQEQDALRELEEVAKKIERKQFKPNTAQCARCDFRSACFHSTAKGVQSGVKKV